MPTEIKISYLAEKRKSILYSEPDTCIVGRSKDCNIQIPNIRKYARVSKYHCIFEINPPDIYVRDFGSLNGTYVNGEKIGQRKKGQSPGEAQKEKFNAVCLKNGDIVRLDRQVALSITIKIDAVCQKCNRPIEKDDLKICERSPDFYICTQCWAVNEDQLYFMSTRTCDGIPGNIQDEICDINIENYLEEPEGNTPSKPAESSKNSKKEDSPFELIDHILAQHNVRRYSHVPTLKEYNIIKLLGEGGMGVVYLIEKKSTTRLYAMKVMRPDAVLTPLRTKRFLIEAENTRSLSHPHIVKFHKHDICDGCFFFVIEYCKGGSVDKLMKENNDSLPMDLALNITIQVLKGLEYAHEAEVKVLLQDGSIKTGKGLVHRDIKPHNLFLTGRNPKDMSIKIGDYGLSKAFQFAGLTGITGPRDGPMGSPYFLPRQYANTSRYAKPDIDIYSTAVSLYYMLTGQFPRDFRGNYSAWQVLLSSSPISIKKRSSTIPVRLAELIDHAVDDRGELHYKTARSFRQELEDCI